MQVRKFQVASALAVLAVIAVGNTGSLGQAPSPTVLQNAPSATAPWMDASLQPDDRADLVQTQMTQDEELTLVRGYLGMPAPKTRSPQPAWMLPDLPSSAGYVPGIPRLGIPALRETDASLGVANGRHMRPGDQATALPASILTASTWNAALAHDAGVMLGSESREKGFNVLLDGGVDLAREPRNGRTFEYVGEDPLLAGVIAGEVIRGAQEQHILSTAKHYALNDQESGRFVMNANIDEAAMRESDLLAFEIAIEHGVPGAVMCAYNKVNGVYACENDFLLNKVLKADWDYRGFVLSDWGAVHSTTMAATNGLDQESASVLDKQDFFAEPLKQALANGEVSAARLHDMAHRILRSMFAHGLFDYSVSRKPIAAQADAAVAERTAEEGIVLLKNQNNLLPLAHPQRIAVIGAHADVGVLSGGGSSQVVPVGDNADNEILVGGPVTNVPKVGVQMPTEVMVYDPPSPLSAIRALAGGASVAFDDGTDVVRAAAMAKAADVAIVFAQQWMREGRDVPGLSLPANQDALIDAVASANPHTIVVLETGGPVVMPWLGKAAAVMEAWYPGQEGAQAIARTLFGLANPSGRLAITFPQSEAQLPRPSPAVAIQTSLDVNYTEGANVGYKWFEAQNLTPLFPFGYGLSYTSFRYSGLSAQGGTTVTVGFDVTNTGARSGKTVAQIYAAPPAAEGRDVRRLIGWSKIDLKPGETRHVSVAADPRLLAHFDVPAHNWHVAAGNYLVSLGESSAASAAYAWVHVDESTIKP
jgi:beta-glucosidase